jgi:hypothetical protein
MGPPSKRYYIILSSYFIDYRPTVEELDITPNDDYSEEEEGYSFNAYPDPEAC